jgi:hypothetical protein
VCFSIRLGQIECDKAQGSHQIQIQFLEKRPGIWLNHCLLERPINLQQEIGRRFIVIEWQRLLSLSFQDSRQTNIELLEDVCHMRSQSSDPDSSIPQNTENLFAGKVLKSSQLTEIETEHDADIHKKHFGIDVWLCMHFQKEICAETYTMVL